MPHAITTSCWPPHAEPSEKGAQAPLEDIAYRPGVGIGTLYRNFPTRRRLLESVYADETHTLCPAADHLAGLESWAALTSWRHSARGGRRAQVAFLQALNEESEVFMTCRACVVQAGSPQLERA
jgi:hypothetical protein